MSCPHTNIVTKQEPSGFYEPEEKNGYGETLLPHIYCADCGAELDPVEYALEEADQ